MKSVFKIFLFAMAFYLISIPLNSFAQSCGGGYTQEGGGGVVSCISTDGGNSQNPVVAGPVWATRWGAIAYDMKNGFMGGVEKQASESKAKKAAIALCKQNGGKECKVQITYYNQCGALAWGNNWMVTAHGPKYQTTIDDAVNSCNKNSSNCKAYYSGCSYAERIR